MKRVMKSVLVLSVLGLAGCDYDSTEQVRDELRGRLGAAAAAVVPTRELGRVTADALPHVPTYGVDAIVRRSPPLQQTSLAADAAAAQ